MTSNVLQALKKHEENPEKPGPVKMAVIAQTKHVDNMEYYLRHPEEFKKIKRLVLKVTKGKFGKAEWTGMTLLKPENLLVEEENAG
jgi:hypothetical protein